eukprot:g6827.t1
MAAPVEEPSDSSEDQTDMYEQVLQLASDSSPRPQFQLQIAQAILQLAEEKQFVDFVVGGPPSAASRPRLSGGARKVARPLLRMVERDPEDVWASVLDQVKSKTQGLQGFPSKAKEDTERKAVVKATRETCNLALQALVNLSGGARDMALCLLDLNAMVRVMDRVAGFVKLLGTRKTAAAARRAKNNREEEAGEDAHEEDEEDSELLQESVQLSVMLLANLSTLVCQGVADSESQNAGSNDASGSTHIHFDKLVTNVAPALFNLFLQPPICGKDLFVHAPTVFLAMCDVREGRGIFAEPMALAVLAQQLLARQRRKNVLKLYCKLAGNCGEDGQAHEALANAQFLPRVCCYFSEPVLDVDHDAKNGGQTKDFDLHPLVLSEAQGITQDAEMQALGIELFYNLTKSAAGRRALNEQKVVPVLKRWSAVEKDAEIKGKLQVLIANAAFIDADAEKKEVVMDTPLIITCDRDGNVASVKAAINAPVEQGGGKKGVSGVQHLFQPPGAPMQMQSYLNASAQIGHQQSSMLAAQSTLLSAAALDNLDDFSDAERDQQLALLFLRVYGNAAGGGGVEGVQKMLNLPQTAMMLGPKFFEALAGPNLRFVNGQWQLGGSAGKAAFAFGGGKKGAGKKGGGGQDIWFPQLAVPGAEDDDDENLTRQEQEVYEKHTTKEGFDFFRHAKTGKKCWIIPSSGAVPCASSSSSSSSNAKPPGGAKKIVIQDKRPRVGEAEDWSAVGSTKWLKVTTTSGLVFYHNRDTETSVWIAPEEIKQELEEMEEADAELDDFVIPDDDGDEDDDVVPQREMDGADEDGGAVGDPYCYSAGEELPGEEEEQGGAQKPRAPGAGRDDDESSADEDDGEGTSGKAAAPVHSGLQAYLAFKEMVAELKLQDTDYATALPSMVHESRFNAVPAKERPALFSVMGKKIKQEQHEAELTAKKEKLLNFRALLEKNTRVQDTLKMFRNQNRMGNMAMVYRGVERHVERDAAWKAVSDKQERERLIKEALEKLTEENETRALEGKKEFAEQVDLFLTGFAAQNKQNRGSIVAGGSSSSSRAAAASNKRPGDHGAEDDEDIAFPKYGQIASRLSHKALSGAECEAIYDDVIRKRHQSGRLVSAKRKREEQMARNEMELVELKKKRLQQEIATTLSSVWFEKLKEKAWSCESGREALKAVGWEEKFREKFGDQLEAASIDAESVDQELTQVLDRWKQDYLHERKQLLFAHLRNHFGPLEARGFQDEEAVQALLQQSPALANLASLNFATVLRPWLVEWRQEVLTNLKTAFQKFLQECQFFGEADVDKYLIEPMEFARLCMRLARATQLYSKLEFAEDIRSSMIRQHVEGIVRRKLKSDEDASRAKNFGNMPTFLTAEEINARVKQTKTEKLGKGGGKK